MNNFKTELLYCLEEAEERFLQLMPSIEEQILLMFTNQINHTQMLQIHLNSFIKIRLREQRKQIKRLCQ